MFVTTEFSLQLNCLGVLWFSKQSSKLLNVKHHMFATAVELSSIPYLNQVTFHKQIIKEGKYKFFSNLVIKEKKGEFIYW